MEPRRFSAKTVDEATDNALEALAVNREDVEIVVVNPGRSGILGFGGEPAEIDVTLLDPVGAGVSEASARAAEAPDDGHGDEESTPAPEDDEFGPDSPDDEFDDEPETVVTYDPVTASETEQDFDAEEPERAEPGREPPERPEPPASRDQRDRPGQRDRSERPSEPDPEVIEFASEVIDYFLASMNVVADTYIRDESDDGVPVFDIEGEDSGLLIGRRGETLQSFQYLVNLIVTHQLGRSAYVQIDIEGYKERRRETLNGVALRTAERVANSGDAIELEPMPAYERRWVHMALANNTEVRTESSGEGTERFVVVYPHDGGGGAPGSQNSRRTRPPRRSPGPRGAPSPGDDGGRE